jgi:4-cresol dehydrogenase (hydroxylating)
MSKDAAQNRQNREIFERLVEVSAENGWGEYRTHVAFMDHVAEAYSFNDHAMRRFHETLKDAVDPKGILSPGKSGIWPRRLRTRQGR